MTWFETLTGCAEETPELVRQHLVIDGRRLHSRLSGRFWVCGELETPTLAQLRERVRGLDYERGQISVREVVANVQHLHCDQANENAVFQVASQFNLLEMTSPGVTPECGVGIYEEDFTQGPACAIAAGAGTIFRNYFADVNGQVGQSANNQIDCLSGIGILLDNSGQRLWQMVNGYALPSPAGLDEINQKLANMDGAALDKVRQALQIGMQWDTQVTLDDASHTVSQAYCSAMPVAYTRHPRRLWAPLASLVLEAAYEATICAAIVNFHRTGNNRLFLTLLGGGAFGNDPNWIIGAIRRSLEIYSDWRLDVAVVSYGGSNRSVRRLASEFARFALVVAGLLIVPSAAAQDVVPARRVGMSGERLERLTTEARRQVKKGNHAGLVSLVARRGEIVYLKAVGKQDRERNVKMRTDTMFRAASFTKSITSLAVLMLYEEGKQPGADNRRIPRWRAETN